MSFHRYAMEEQQPRVNTIPASCVLVTDDLPSEVRTIKLTLAYDGTKYAGWQFQPEHSTIQGALEKAILKITTESVRVVGSGRTDAGVHALGQVASFRTQCQLSPEVLHRALNAELPRDIVILDVAAAPLDFHPIRDAHRKRYRYVVHDGRWRDVFQLNYAWQYRHRLDVDAMQRAALALVGKHDFASFETAGSERDSSVRTVFELAVARISENCVTVEIEADGFLYNMVRTIVGTLVEVGRGERPENWPAEVLAAVDRRAAGATAPPQGLFLVRVDYS